MLEDGREAALLAAQPTRDRRERCIGMRAALPHRIQFASTLITWTHGEVHAGRVTRETWRCNWTAMIAYLGA